MECVTADEYYMMKILFHFVRKKKKNTGNDDLTKSIANLQMFY